MVYTTSICVILSKFLPQNDPTNEFNQNQIHTQQRYDVYETPDQFSAKVTEPFRSYVVKCCSRAQFRVILAEFLPNTNSIN